MLHLPIIPFFNFFFKGNGEVAIREVEYIVGGT